MFKQRPNSTSISFCSVKHWPMAWIAVVYGLWHCTVVLHCGTALWHYTVVLHCGTALWHCTVALHCSTTLWHCTVALHCGTALRTALWHCTVALHCSTAVWRCTAALHWQCITHCAVCGADNRTALRMVPTVAPQECCLALILTLTAMLH